MPTKTLMTGAQFAKTGPETDGYELVRGELVPMPPPKRPHGQVCANIVTLLGIYKKSRGTGSVVSNETGIITERDPDTVRGVDVAYFLTTTESGLSPNRYIDEPPDLAVEVRSEKQFWNSLLAKAQEYLQMGVRMVWIVNPRRGD